MSQANDRSKGVLNTSALCFPKIYSCQFQPPQGRQQSHKRQSSPPNNSNPSTQEENIVTTETPVRKSTPVRKETQKGDGEKEVRICSWRGHFVCGLYSQLLSRLVEVWVTQGASPEGHPGRACQLRQAVHLWHRHLVVHSWL